MEFWPRVSAFSRPKSELILNGSRKMSKRSCAYIARSCGKNWFYKQFSVQFFKTHKLQKNINSKEQKIHRGEENSFIGIHYFSVYIITYLHYLSQIQVEPFCCLASWNRSIHKPLLEIEFAVRAGIGSVKLIIPIELVSTELRCFSRLF